MFKRKRLVCSFCGKSAAEVSKLVAGPKVFICDRCVAEASRIMSDPSIGESAQRQPALSIWRCIGVWLGHQGNTRNSLEALHFTNVAGRAV